MARKTLLVSDLSGAEIAEGKGAKLRISFEDNRVGSWEADLTEEEGRKFTENARKVNKRGRPKAKAAA